MPPHDNDDEDDAQSSRAEDHYPSQPESSQQQPPPSLTLTFINDLMTQPQEWTSHGDASSSSSSYLQHERAIAVIMELFFTSANLATDLGLRRRMKDSELREYVHHCGLDDVVSKDPESVHAWVDIEFFAARDRLGDLAGDEVVVAKGVRENSNILEVSEDGKLLRLKPGIESSPTDIQLDPTRTLYVDNIPHKSTADSICAAFTTLRTSVSKVFLPAALSAHDCISRLPDMNSHTSFTMQIEGGSDAEGQRRDRRPWYPSYVFVEFETRDACDFVLREGNRFVEMRTSTLPSELLRLIKDDLQCPASERLGWPGCRLLSFEDWKRRSLEYMELQTERIKDVAAAKLNAFHKNGRPDGMVSGTVCEFQNVHPMTTPRVLKHLFEFLAPVSYVDYQPRTNRTSGHVRFKTDYGARLAQVYFNTECVVQKHKDDSGTLITERMRKKLLSKKKQQKRKNLAKVDSSQEISDDVAIRLVVLDAKKEWDYWEAVRTKEDNIKERDGGYAFEGDEIVEDIEEEVQEPVVAETEAGPPIKKRRNRKRTKGNKSSDNVTIATGAGPSTMGRGADKIPEMSNSKDLKRKVTGVLIPPMGKKIKFDDEDDENFCDGDDGVANAESGITVSKTGTHDSAGNLDATEDSTRDDVGSTRPRKKRRTRKKGAKAHDGPQEHRSVVAVPSKTNVNDEPGGTGAEMYGKKRKVRDNDEGSFNHEVVL